MSIKTIEYPTVVYKNRKKNAFIANCVMHNLMGFGKTKNDAIKNLQKSIEDNVQGHKIIIKPVDKLLLSC